MKTPTFFRFPLGLMLCLLLACGSTEEPETPPPAAPAPEGDPVVAAHYYSWYSPEHHWENGIYREPLLGRYDSADPQVAEQHIRWATAAGIDVFAVEWTGSGYNEENIRQGLLRASNLDRMEFCIFYDTDVRLEQFGFADPTFLDFSEPLVREIFIDDMIQISHEYFRYPSYYKIHDKPVVWLYLTRSFKGTWRAVLQEAKQVLEARGHQIYFIGDETWYDPPDAERLPHLDAVSTYSLYDPSQMKARPSWQLSEFAEMILPVYELWQRDSLLSSNLRSTRPVPFMPAVSIQFDDSSVRGDRHSPVHASSPEEVRDALQSVRNIALSNTDPEEQVVWITSFNEWHEGTSIEPTVEQGDPYLTGNYGFEWLRLISEVFDGQLHLENP